jgi:hypothetical protein
MQFRDGHRPGLFAVAYPHREDFKPAYREPVQKFIDWDGW